MSGLNLGLTDMRVKGPLTVVTDPDHLPLQEADMIDFFSKKDSNFK